MAAGRIDSVNLDAVLKEEPVYRVTVTKHPVERGSQITDHAHPELLALNIEAIVSEFDGDPAAAHQILTALWRKPRPITVELPRGIYGPVVIEEYAPIYELRTGAALHFRCRVTEWKVVNTLLAATKATAAQVKKGPAKQVDKPTPPRKTALKRVGQAADKAFDRLLSGIGFGSHPGVE